MNYFSLAGVMVSAKPTADYIRAVALGWIFGHNKDFFTDTGQGFKFKLPFALTNLTVVALTDALYDSASQGVNEFSDRPFAMKGLITVISTLTTDTLWKKDMDNYISWEVSADSGGTPVLYTIAIGVLNSTLTESYTPLASVDEAVYYDEPRLSANPNVIKYLPTSSFSASANGGGVVVVDGVAMSEDQYTAGSGNAFRPQKYLS